MSTLMLIPNLYATGDSQTKFEANCMKNGKVTALRIVEEDEQKEVEEEYDCRKYVNLDVDS